jgi:hypothetical protein
MDDSTNPRAPGERPREGQGHINGVDIRDLPDRQLLRELVKPWGPGLMDMLRAEAKYRHLV